MKCNTLRSLRTLRAWGLCLLIFFCSANVALAKSGTLNPTGRDIELISLLKISDSVLGEAEVVITADDKILLPKESTLILLEGLVTDDALTALRNSTAEASLSQKHFSSAGLDLTFDFSTLECIVTVPSQFLKTQQLSANSLMYTDSNHLSPAWMSGYVNLSLSGNQSKTVDDSSVSVTSFNHRIDSALNIGSANFEYEAVYENVEGESSTYARQGTRMNMDFPSQGTRLVIGDMFNAGKNLQDSADILGIGLTRDFTLIPTRNVRPKATQSFTLQRTSNVDVLVDGIVVQRLTLNAGSYNLSDIPLAEGTNDVELVITDSSGKEERIQFSVATGNDLLDSGEFEYSLMVGVPSEAAGNKIEYQSSEYLAHGYFDYGVTPWLTLGINAQSREDLYQYGVSSLIATSIGVTEFIVSQSSHPSLGSGYAYRVAYDADLLNDPSLNPQLSIIYDYQSENYSGVGDYDSSSTSLNSVEHYVSLFSSIDVTSRLRAALSGSYSSGSKTDDNFWTVSPSLSGPLFGTPATWSSRFNYRDYKYDHGSDDEFSTTLSLSWPLSKQTRVVSRYQSDKDLGSVDVSYKDGVGSAGGVSAYATLVTERNIDSNLDAGVNYTGNRIRIIADHTTRYQDLNEDDRSHNTRFELSSAIAFAGTSVAVGREVGEAFAIVKKHKSLAENKVAIDPERNTEYSRVYSVGDSNMLVPDLVAYSSQLITYDVDDLPPGYDLGDGAFSVYPGNKQGYELEVGSDAVLTVIGSLFHAVTKEPIALIAGKAYYLGKESGNKVQVDKNHEPLEFFTNRKGKFAISGMKPGHYRLELNTKKKQTLEITLPENSDVLVRIGEMYVD